MPAVAPNAPSAITPSRFPPPPRISPVALEIEPAAPPRPASPIAAPSSAAASDPLTALAAAADPVALASADAPPASGASTHRPGLHHPARSTRGGHAMHAGPNALGIIGFILALLAFLPLTGALWLWPIAAACLGLSVLAIVLAAIGLRHPSKGLAFVGIIIAIIAFMGSLTLTIQAAVNRDSLMHTLTAEDENAKRFTTEALNRAVKDIKDRAAAIGRLPTEGEGQQIIVFLHDAYDHNLRYHPLDQTHFEIRAPNRDGTFTDLPPDHVVRGSIDLASPE